MDAERNRMDNAVMYVNDIFGPRMEHLNLLMRKLVDMAIVPDDLPSWCSAQLSALGYSELGTNDKFGNSYVTHKEFKLSGKV